jgi:hypothetical protein
MTFSLRNTGAAAIMAKDVMEPLRLVFPPSTRLMSANVERTFPQDLKFSARAVPDSEQVVLDFPLLNRGDEAFFSVYVFNSELQRPSLEGRIVDVPQLVYSEANVPTANRGSWPFQSHATRSVVRWVLVTIYGGLTLLFLGIGVSGIGSYVSYLPWKSKWKRLYDEVREELSKTYRQEREARKAALPAIPAPIVGPEGEVAPEEVYRSAIMHGRFILDDNRITKELEKRGIPPNPHPMVESIGGLAMLVAAMVSLALVCSTTGLIVYRALAA